MTNVRETRLPEVLRRVHGRLRALAAARGATVGAGVAIALLLLGGSLPVNLLLFGVVGVVTVVLLVVWYMSRVQTNSVSLALTLERRAPECRNLVVTAAELVDGDVHVSEGMRALVFRQAEARLRGVELARLFPLAPTLLLLAGALALWALVAWWSSPASLALRDELRIAQKISPSAPLTIARVDATVSAPAYSQRAKTDIRDPDRIEALAGSSAELTVRSNASLVWLVRGTDTTQLTRNNNSFAAGFSIEDDGYVVLLASRENDNTVVRRIIGISATPDASPRVRILEPGRDLFVPDSNRVILVSIDATDDLALGSLHLRYTKVSGSGERFTFEEGELPVKITRTSDLEWKATGNLPLASLKLARGDMLVYRAVATDRQPGATPVESDAFIVEVMSDLGAAVDGFSVDPEEDRYAMSQQMIIVKTERLIAQQQSLSRDELVAASRSLSAEQRRVRAEFVFMMGGELAEEVAHEASMDDLDESQHAEAEGDLSAGRMVNPSRAAIFAAIRAMSRAMTALEGAELSTALQHERRAVVELEKAFARTRYLLRAFSQREALDLTRRMTGNVADAASYRGPASTPVSSVGATQLRMVLRELQRGGMGQTVDHAQLAEVVLSVDPSAKALQAVAAQLARLDRENDFGAARAIRDSATQSIARLIGQEAGSSQGEVQTPTLRVLQGRVRDVPRGRWP